MRGGDRRSAPSPSPEKPFPADRRSEGSVKRRKVFEESESRFSFSSQRGGDQRHRNSFARLRCSNHSNRNRRKEKCPLVTERRRWVYASREFTGDEDKVVILSYNILGVENALKHPDLYPNVPPEYLTWEWRKNLIHEEINRYNPSIMCFQEVDQFNDVNDLLHKDGFKGIYKARTGEALDGCAIFWKDKNMSLLHHESIEFRSFGLRDNIAQFCVLKINRMPSGSNSTAQASQHAATRCLLVGNIHVLYNPKRGDIKLGQIRLFLEKAHKLSQDWGGIPVVIAGDLNCLPQSAAYQFVASSELDILQHNRRRISGQDRGPQRCRAFRYRGATSFWETIPRPVNFGWSDEEIKLATGSEHVTRLQHCLKLSSAYIDIPGSSRTRDKTGEPSVTSYHSEFMGTVDYIWHTEELVPVRVLETLPLSTLRNLGGLPSKEWGSDHLALVCELAFAGDVK